MIILLKFIIIMISRTNKVKYSKIDKCCPLESVFILYFILCFKNVYNHQYNLSMNKNGFHTKFWSVFFRLIFHYKLSLKHSCVYLYTYTIINISIWIERKYDLFYANFTKNFNKFRIGNSQQYNRRDKNEKKKMFKML